MRARGLAFAVFTTPPPADARSRPPLVCVNGGMLYDHSMLWPALSPLAATRQVILYDQRGRGQSEAPADPGSATIDDDAADLAALRRALGIRQWDVLGHSWGGGIAMLATAIDQAGTRRLVTVDAVGPSSDWMRPLRANVLARLEGDDRATLEAIDEASLASADPELHARHARAVYPAWFAEAEMASYFAPPKTTSITGAAILAKLRSGYDWHDRLRALSTPTLVLHGEQDALPVTVSAQLQALFPNSQRVLLPDSGHMPFWETPERFFSLVESFLEAQQPGAVRLPL